MVSEEQENLPEVSEAVLSDDELAALIRDLRACTEIAEIRIKSGPGSADEHQQSTLDDAAQLLFDRSVRGVQIRYRFDDADWMDTLMPVAEGIRLVRIRHDFDSTP
jgi:hypothetical protein